MFSLIATLLDEKEMERVNSQTLCAFNLALYLPISGKCKNLAEQKSNFHQPAPAPLVLLVSFRTAER